MTTITEYVPMDRNDPDAAETLDAYARHVQQSLPAGVRFEAKLADRHNVPNDRDVVRELGAYCAARHVMSVAWVAACGVGDARRTELLGGGNAWNEVG